MRLNLPVSEVALNLVRMEELTEPRGGEGGLAPALWLCFKSRNSR
jgi:hypothetical protein